ncbi:MAG: hypothetical protein M1827_001296 [Pycnora praestabilis]|nr:MAG: hypothetical protein M1827_001296 [Pycnora praestabilis]
MKPLTFPNIFGEEPSSDEEDEWEDDGEIIEDDQKADPLEEIEWWYNDSWIRKWTKDYAPCITSPAGWGGEGWAGVRMLGKGGEGVIGLWEKRDAEGHVVQVISEYFPQPFLGQTFYGLTKALLCLANGQESDERAPDWGDWDEEIVHRDINPVNFFLDDPAPVENADFKGRYPTAKLGDFGYAVRTSRGEANDSKAIRGSFYGTWTYRAPVNTTTNGSGTGIFRNTFSRKGNLHLGPTRTPLAG